MYFGVIHQNITDWKRFNGLDWDHPPEGMRSLAYFPGSDHTSAICLWYAESGEDLCRFLDTLCQGISLNRCFQVDESAAVGLPKVPAGV